MKKKYLVLLTAFFICTSSHAQDFKKDYQQLRNKDADEKVLLKQLEKWQKAKPSDPEMFVAFSNFYFSKSQKEMVRLDKSPGKEEHLELTDSLGNKAGYMYSEITFTDSLVKKAYNFLEEALAANPKRLDIYFGQIYLQEQTQQYKDESRLIIQIINKFSAAQAGWLWTDNKPCEDMPEFFINTIYKYCTNYFNAEQDEEVIAVANIMMEKFSSDIRFYSMAGSSKAGQVKYEEATFYYKKALDINAKDIVVLHNLAYVYNLMKDKIQATYYYNEIIKYGSAEDKAEAKERIQQLKD